MKSHPRSCIYRWGWHSSLPSWTALLLYWNSEIATLLNDIAERDAAAVRLLGFSVTLAWAKAQTCSWGKEPRFEANWQVIRDTCKTKGRMESWEGGEGQWEASTHLLVRIVFKKRGKWLLSSSMVVGCSCCQEMLIEGQILDNSIHHYFHNCLHPSSWMPCLVKRRDVLQITVFGKGSQP